MSITRSKLIIVMFAAMLLAGLFCNRIQSVEAFYQPSGSDSYNLKLMSFNVRNLNGDDGTVNSWDNRKSRAVNVINGYGPDIIGMQEAYKVQIDYFLDQLPNYGSIGQSRYGDTTNEYSNIMYRTDKFDVMETGQFWISDTPDVAGSKSASDSSYPRIVTWAKFRAQSDNQTIFYYFNTHFSLKAAAQAQGASLLLDRIASYVKPDNTPVFIGGDLNSDETSSVYSTLNGSSFQDTWAQLGKPFTDDSTAHQWTGEKDMANQHIDWIFQRNAVKVNSVEINYYTESDLYPSDHYPLQVNVDIPRTGEPQADRASGGTITATYTDSPTNEDMSKAFDNDKTTKYYVPHGTDVKLQYQFGNGGKYAINRYKLTSANDNSGIRDPKSWTVQGSNDGTNWTTIDTRTNESFPLRYQTREFRMSNTTRYEYIRFSFTSNNGSNFQISEIELYDYVNLTVAGTKTADAYNSGEEPGLGADGYVSTGKWCASGAEPHWLKIDLGAVMNIYQFVVKHAASGGETKNYNTADYQIQYSNDGTNWTDAAVVTDNTANVTTHNVNLNARYLRLYITDATQTSNTAARIYEFEAFGLQEGATFYKDADYGGIAVSLPKGSYTLAQLQEAGFSNDSLSSLRVYGGSTVELYKNNNFQGDVLTRTADDNKLSDDGFNDVVSSIKIN
ncbi:discoidin domain-containing protein [Cohnella fermenti]|uniref:F5/8 type C domain-containing protein n=1 Tax=Cohnella fermenti TaxID=2565925 RepID=A0A4S4BYM1_9BACL|nr:discoidin domain-containing protein [Cohnella fermenti]THF80366.1 hypothetical protein E6C55_10820 [Cohnella fermenti]